MNDGMVYSPAPLDPVSVLAPIVSLHAPLALGGGIDSSNYDRFAAQIPTNVEAISCRAEERAGAGDALRELGHFQAAVLQYDRAIAMCPSRGEFHFLKGVCELALGNRDAAHECLRAAVRLKPDLACGHEWLSQWYLEEGLIEQAKEHSELAYQLAPCEFTVIAARAYVLEAAGDLDAAWGLLQALLSKGYTPPKVATLYARMAPRRDHRSPALDLILRQLQAGGNSTRGEAGLHFAAADLLDGMGRYDDAFAHAITANRLKRSPYNPADLERLIDERITFFTPEHSKCLPKATYRGVRSVFIVGMPRSGTSLVEQIIASHPQVHGAGELDLINRIIPGAQNMMAGPGGHYPDCLDSLSIDKANGLAQLYLEPIAALNRSATHITDKMPLNFLYMGLISVLFPQARVINCRRNPLDTCLSCFLTNFASANQFTYDLSHLGHFYRQYERLMAHWKAVLPVPILDVSYEELVGNQESQSRRLIEFIDLPWDDRCLRFHETRRFVATASVEQVRRPVYRSSIGRWKNYEKHLGELVAALV